VRKAKHHACRGTPALISWRKLAFTHTRAGFRRFAQTLRNPLVQTRGQRLLIALEPSGLYGQARYERLNGWGYAVWLVHGHAVRHNRKTMQEGTRKTAKKDAYSVFDWLRPGRVVLPVERAPAWKAAYRLRQRPMALKQRIRQRRTSSAASRSPPCVP
jgi:hypothetical protein